MIELNSHKDENNDPARDTYSNYIYIISSIKYNGLRSDPDIKRKNIIHVIIRNGKVKMAPRSKTFQIVIHRTQDSVVSSNINKFLMEIQIFRIEEIF